MTDIKSLIKIKNILPVLFVIALYVFPFVAQTYYLGVMVIIAINIILVTGLSLLMGYAGQISLGHAAFYGMGAYGSAILSTVYKVNPWLAILIAALITGLVAFLIGKIILKLQEHYLALGTLGLGLIIHAVFIEETEITGGPSGFTGIPYLKISGLALDTDFKFYFLVWSIALIVLLLIYNIVNSRVGRALKSIHGSDYAARSLGVDTIRYKVQVFTLSSVLASIAGSLYAHYVTFISPAPFGLMTSIQFLVMAVIGGLATTWGPVLGAVVITILGEFLRNYIPFIFPTAGGEYEIIVFGLILVIVMIFMPNGISASLSKIFKADRGTNLQKRNLLINGKEGAHGSS